MRKSIYTKKVLALPKDKQMEVYHALNHWGWHEALGPLPPWWYEPGYGKEKDKLISSVNRTIKKRIGEKELLRYHHVTNLGRTDRQFEAWWVGTHEPTRKHEMQRSRARMIFSRIRTRR